MRAAAASYYGWARQGHFPLNVRICATIRANFLHKCIIPASPMISPTVSGRFRLSQSLSCWCLYFLHGRYPRTVPGNHSPTKLTLMRFWETSQARITSSDILRRGCRRRAGPRCWSAARARRCPSSAGEPHGPGPLLGRQRGRWPGEPGFPRCCRDGPDGKRMGSSGQHLRARNGPVPCIGWTPA